MHVRFKVISPKNLVASSCKCLQLMEELVLVKYLFDDLYYIRKRYLDDFLSIVDEYSQILCFVLVLLSVLLLSF